jgi:gamma-tubulin complex component 2
VDTTAATFLLKAASQPMLDRLEKWLYHGVVDDAHQEFMVFDHVDISKDTMTDDYNAVYWDKRYTVRAHQVPTFLAHQADVILTTGSCCCSRRGAPL